MHADLASSIQTQASQCVKCGLCLPYCPTYGLTQNENESPRGRIALMQNLATEALTFSAKAHEHIDNCLSCKECERVCPAQVSYENLLLDYRAWEKPKLKSQGIKPSFSAQFFEYVATHPRARQQLGKLLWIAQKLKLRLIAEKLGLLNLLGLKRLNALLPKTLPAPSALKPFYAAIGPKQGTVALFTGCLSSLFDAQTNQDAITVLQHLGYDVKVPSTQTCCGALSNHAGNAEQATELSRQNVDAFFGPDLKEIDTIISTASGCASMLIRTGSFSGKLKDVSAFIYESTWPSSVLNKLTTAQTHFASEKIAIHTPCTLRNALKTPLQSQQLLEKLGLNCEKLQTFEQCCGSAGAHMLSHADTSENLLDSALIDLDKISPTRLVTSNIGCALHFQKRFTEKNTHIRVCHPISLFAEMLAKA